ncbi:MAG: gamma-glutamyltransferase, partial [Bacteroidota bacterium]
QEAVAVPRIHHQWLPDMLFAEPFALQPDVAEALRTRGWTVTERGGYSGRADGILVVYEDESSELDPSGLSETVVRTLTRQFFGGADPRGDDVAVGY